MKITTQTNPAETSLEVEGKLAMPWIEELEKEKDRIIGATGKDAIAHAIEARMGAALN